MNKICTTIKQSKKLLELGIDINTADMLWVEDYNHNFDLEVRVNVVESYNPDNTTMIPAWSLTALLEIIPNVEIKSKVQNFDKESWCVSSHDDKDHNHIWVYNDELVDACVELIYKLKEQNHDTRRRSNK